MVYTYSIRTHSFMYTCYNLESITLFYRCTCMSILHFHNLSMLFMSNSIECDLEGRFSHIRTRETNLGNLVTDIMRSATRSDVALLNSGTFRSDAVHKAGAFRVKVSCTYIHTCMIDVCKY